MTDNSQEVAFWEMRPWAAIARPRRTLADFRGSIRQRLPALPTLRRTPAWQPERSLYGA
jgi:hypothetical protein